MRVVCKVGKRCRFRKCYIPLSAEENNKGREKSSLLSNAFEAGIGLVSRSRITKK